MNSDRLWLRFVVMALVSALLPGFGLITFVVITAATGGGSGAWYHAAIQAHGTAMLMGWGGAMILGVALHFLPRLRGTKLVGRGWVPVLFWLLAGGLTLRIVGQFCCATLDATAPHTAVTIMTMAVAAGVWLQAIAVWGLLAVLAATFRAGPPLPKTHGFRQITPLLLVAASALVLAQLLWSVSVLENIFGGRNLSTLPLGPQWAAEDLMLFGFIAAISMAMSSRLFPLTFRIQLPRPRWLKIAAVFLAGGVALTLAGGLGIISDLSDPSAGRCASLAALAYAAGLLAGTVGVQVFRHRKPIVGNQPPYRIAEDPAAVGVASAYLWVVVAALFLLGFALHQFGVHVPLPLADRNLARHTAGAGFMTLLILSVGWKMLPGFGGGRPRARGLMWTAVGLGNAAALLRILPALLTWGIRPERDWSRLLFPLAGLAGLGAILAFALALTISLGKRESAHAGPDKTRS